MKVSKNSYFLMFKDQLTCNYFQILNKIIVYPFIKNIIIVELVTYINSKIFLERMSL